MANQEFYRSLKSKIEQARTKDIESVLLTLTGATPQRRTTNRLKYLSPFRDEKTPSFVVRTDKNDWCDFGEERRKNDVIELVQRLKGCSLIEAVDILNGDKFNFQNTPQNPKPISKKENSNRYIHRHNRALHPSINGLMQYLNDRKISFEIASQYCLNVNYRDTETGKNRFGIGWETDNGGHIVRYIGELGKGRNYTNIGTCGATTVQGCQTGCDDTVFVFEGMFDFLALATLIQGKKAFHCTIIILNGVGNVNQIDLSSYSLICSFLDDDKAGKNALQSLVNNYGDAVHDYRHLYSGYGDLANAHKHGQLSINL